MSIVEVMSVRLTGMVDERILEVLCDELQMEPEGRLDDDWDDKFGMRWLRPAAEGDAWVGLYRQSDTDWTVEVSAEPPYPTPQELAELSEQIASAAEKASLTAERTYLRRV